jgi:GNAT superfamily N-acetyltransferase
LLAPRPLSVHVRQPWVRSVRIRRLEPHEIALHRDLRLCALRDSPESFAETAAEAEARPFSYWEDLTRSVTEPDRHVMFLAYEGDAVFGSTYGLRDSENRDAARVGGTWVAPSHRRRGVGRALLQAVLTWGRNHGFKRLRLWAPSANTAAHALYFQAGFVETGRRRPLPTNTELQIVELECKLPTP